MTSNRILALSAAITFAAVGVWGAAGALLSGDPLGTEITLPGQLGTSLLLAIVHLGLAGALIVGWSRGDRLSRLINTAVGTVLLAIGLFGLFAIGTPANIAGLTGATNVLHFAASATLLAAGLGAAPITARETGSRQGDG